MMSNVKAVLRARYHLRAAETLGPRVRIFGAPSISIEGRLVIGDRVRLVSTLGILQIAVGPEALLELEDRVVINYGTSVGALQHVRIGRGSRIGSHCNVIDHSFHYLDPERRDERPPSAPVLLESNVWLASRVMVMPGVTIGVNSVIGCGSVVTRDVPSNVLAAGSPARVIRSLRKSDVNSEIAPLSEGRRRVAAPVTEPPSEPVGAPVSDFSRWRSRRER